MDAIASPDDNHKFACVYHDYNGNLAVRYAAKDPTANEDEKKAVNTTDKERAKALKEAIKKVKAWEGENLCDMIDGYSSHTDDAAFAGKIFAYAFAYRVANGSFGCSLRDLARDLLLGRKIIRSFYVKSLAEAIDDLEDTSASTTLSIFEEANDAVTPEESRLVRIGK